MRTTFLKTLVELAEKDDRIVLLTGDLGYLVVDEFAAKFPDRFFNVGVAEQNMLGVATGLAEAGFIPFVYSIVTFAALRPYEFIRNGPVMHRFPVRIVGVGGGMEYGYNGPTHYGIEDVGLMRIQPGMTVVVPADFQQTKTALQATYDLPGPVYYRLGKDEKTVIPGLSGRFTLDGGQILGQGKDALLVTMGSIASEVVKLAEASTQKGYSPSLFIVSAFNPAPAEDLKKALPDFKLVLTIEEHYINGGLGSWTAEIIAENNFDCRLVRCGIKNQVDGITGSHQFMLKHYGLSAEKLLETALDELKKHF